MKNVDQYESINCIYLSCRLTLARISFHKLNDTIWQEGASNDNGEDEEVIQVAEDDDDTNDDDEDDAHGVDSEDPFSEPIIVWEKNLYQYACTLAT